MTRFTHYWALRVSLRSSFARRVNQAFDIGEITCGESSWLLNKTRRITSRFVWVFWGHRLLMHNVLTVTRFVNYFYFVRERDTHTLTPTLWVRSFTKDTIRKTARAQCDNDLHWGWIGTVISVFRKCVYILFIPPHFLHGINWKFNLNLVYLFFSKLVVMEERTHANQ